MSAKHILPRLSDATAAELAVVEFYESFFFFSSRRRHTRSLCDWSSDCALPIYDWEGGNYWTLAGYPGAIAGANRPSRQMWWPVLDDDSDGNAEEIEYEADATPGDSGGPVLDRKSVV